MATGDLTRDTGSPRQMGNVFLLEGTLEADTTKTAFALTSEKSRLISVVAVAQDGASAAIGVLNQNAAGTAVNGSVAITGTNASAETFRYQAYYV